MARRAGDLLGLGRRGERAPRPASFSATRWASSSALRGHDVVADLGGVGQVDLLRTVLGQPGLGLGRVALARPDRRRGAQLPGERQRLEGLPS